MNKPISLKIHKLILVILLFFINFGGIPGLEKFRLLSLLFLFVVILDVLVNSNFLTTPPRKGIYLILMLAIMVILGVLLDKRDDFSIQHKLFKIISFITFITAFFSVIIQRLRKNNSLSTFISFVYLPITLFVSINLLLFFLGFSNNDYKIGSSIILSNLGINFGRVNFILSTGINAYGSFLGILLSLSLIGVSVIKKRRGLFTFGFIVAFTSLILTDSRGPLIYSFLIFIVIKFYYFKVNKPRLLFYIPILGVIGPIILLMFLTFLSTTEYAFILTREGGDLATGNSRGLIWGIAILEFFQSSPLHQFFGYGEYGHFSSGASLKWAFVFGNQEGGDLMHPHNTYLSILFDYGYIGLCFFFLIQFKIVQAIKEGWNTNRELYSLVLGNLLYFNLVGIGETMFGFYYQNVLYVFFMINIFAFLLREKSDFNNYKI